MAAVAIILWSASLILPIFGVLKAFHRFRLPADIERKGIDIWKHGEEAYPLVAYGHGWDELENTALVLEQAKKEKQLLRGEWHPVATIWHDPSRYENGTNGTSRRVRT